MGSPARKKLLAAAVASGLLVALAVLAVEAGRARRIYTAQKSGRGWSGRVHEADPKLGFRLVPGGSGFEELPIGPPVLVRIDAEGFRVPSTEAPAPPRPLILALGCSHTFGSCCAAEETWPLQVARALDGTCKNGGVCGYGLAQMLILARQLIPRDRPDVVLFQYSPWLIDRARARAAPSYCGTVPTPWFGDAPGGPRLLPPDFAPLVFELPVGEYLKTPRGFGDLLSFECRVGLPLLFHDDGHDFARRLRAAFAASDRPAAPEAIAESVAEEVVSLCKQYGARLAVVELTKVEEPRDFPDPWTKRGCLVVKAREALWKRLGSTDASAFAQAYATWRGDPPVKIDNHPNPLAHGIIAQAVVEALGGTVTPR